MAAIAALLEHTSVRALTASRFVGESLDLGWGRVFGGQLLGQGLAAAQATTSDDRVAHSLHSYFLRGGSVDSPVTYDVAALRDGLNVSTRQVSATQGGKLIFTMTVSFQAAFDGLEHSDVMPTVPAPAQCVAQDEFMHEMWDTLSPSLRCRHSLPITNAVDVRWVQALHPMRPTVHAPTRQLWLRVRDQMPSSLHVQVPSLRLDTIG